MLQSNVSAQNLREMIQQIPNSADLVIGTASGEQSFTYKIELDSPAIPTPDILMDAPSLTWRDFYYLKDGSSMQIGTKQIPLQCAIFLGMQSADRQNKIEDNYHIEVDLEPTKKACNPANRWNFTKNWLYFRFDTDKPGKLLEIEVSHLLNTFHAFMREEVHP